MTIGRNSPCICGSGKKYKKCCSGKESKMQTGNNKNTKKESGYNSDTPYTFFECEVDILSNSVMDLIESRDFDKARAICRKLQDEFPDQVDGIERLASVYEAEGNIAEAVQYYRKTVEFMKTNPGFDNEGIKFYEEKVVELGK